MRQLLATLMVMGCMAPPAAALQSRGGTASGGSTVRACSLLTRELVTQVTPLEKQALALTLSVPPMEDPVGASGSACSYGGVTMQVDPFTPAVFDKTRDSTWMAVPNLGDVAYFRDNRGRFAELYVRSGTRVLTIQMDVPTGRTSASIQPNTIALAKELLSKLR